MNANIPPETENRFILTGYVKNPKDDFLSYIVIEELTVILLIANYGGQKINQELCSGISIEKLIQNMGPLQYTMAQFPIQDLLSLFWNEHTSQFNFTYRQDSKTKRFQTFVNSDESRTTLLYILQSHFRDPFHYEQKSAGVFRVAWSFLLGSLFSIMAFIWYCFYWDPAHFQNGNLGDRVFLMVGQKLGALIAAGVVIGMVYNTWNAIKKRSQIYYCHIQNINHCSD